MTAKMTAAKIREKNASLRTMLSRTRRELREAEAALEAVLQTIEGTDHDEKARQAAEEAVARCRAEGPRADDSDDDDADAPGARGGRAGAEEAGDAAGREKPQR